MVSNSRFHRLRQRIQHILDLAGLFAQLVQGAGVRGHGVVGAGGLREAGSQVVAGCAADCGHGGLRWMGGRKWVVGEGDRGRCGREVVVERSFLIGM